MKYLTAYLKWSFVMLSYIVMVLLSLILYIPIVYPCRRLIRKYKDNYKVFYFLWLFLNDTKKASESDIDYGDYGRYQHNIIGAFRQSVIRNNSWNYKLVRGKGLNSQISEMKIICYDGKNAPMWFRNYTIWGYQWCNYMIDYKKYFRMSFSFKIGAILWNMQAGTSRTRYLAKMRFKKL